MRSRTRRAQRIELRVLGYYYASMPGVTPRYVLERMRDLRARGTGGAVAAAEVASDDDAAEEGALEDSESDDELSDASELGDDGALVIPGDAL